MHKLLLWADEQRAQLVVVHRYVVAAVRIKVHADIGVRRWRERGHPPRCATSTV